LYAKKSYVGAFCYSTIFNSSVSFNIHDPEKSIAFENGTVLDYKVGIKSNRIYCCTIQRDSDTCSCNNAIGENNTSIYRWTGRLRTGGLEDWKTGRLRTGRPEEVSANTFEKDHSNVAVVTIDVTVLVECYPVHSNIADIERCVYSIRVKLNNEAVRDANATYTFMQKYSNKGILTSKIKAVEINGDVRNQNHRVLIFDVNILLKNIVPGLSNNDPVPFTRYIP
jgi:hypothetical protein